MRPEFTITIEDETGAREYEILATIEYDDTEYAALVPVGEEEPEALIYRYSEDAHGVPEIEPIDDEDEFAEVLEVFTQALEELDEDE